MKKENKRIEEALIGFYKVEIQKKEEQINELIKYIIDNNIVGNDSNINIVDCGNL